MKLALYKRPGNSPAHWAAHIITCVVVTVRDSFRKRRFTPCKYSHAELVINDVAYSSSARDKGVRGKTLTLVPERWVVVEIDGDSRGAIAYISKREGTPYGWPDLLGFLLPVSLNTAWEFCSEIVARGLIYAGFQGIGKPQKTAPEHLFQWAKTQPGYRIVQADELLKEWRA